jgi:shikimate kinase
VIVGCGGGTPCVGKNMELMNSLGITVWLQASHDVLLRRLLEAQSARPLLNGMDCDTLSAFIDTKLQ